MGLCVWHSGIMLCGKEQYCKIQSLGTRDKSVDLNCIKLITAAVANSWTGTLENSEQLCKLTSFCWKE